MSLQIHWNNKQLFTKYMGFIQMESIDIMICELCFL